MKNILTIDFDIMMSPCIEVYNHFIPMLSWKELKQNPYFNIFSFNADFFSNMTNILITLFKILPSDKIKFIEDHDMIVKYINSKINLINIDHHHDTGYREENNNIYHKANWIKYLYNNNKINNCCWIKNSDSLMPLEDNIIIFNKIINISELNLKDIFIPDEIYICFSPEWIPPEYHSLFGLWIDLAEEFYHKKFQIEKKLKI